LGSRLFTAVPQGPVPGRLGHSVFVVRGKEMSLWLRGEGSPATRASVPSRERAAADVEALSRPVRVVAGVRCERPGDQLLLLLEVTLYRSPEPGVVYCVRAVGERR
jgi:hypothetical protein